MGRSGMQTNTGAQDTDKWDLLYQPEIDLRTEKITGMEAIFMLSDAASRSAETAEPAPAADTANWIGIAGEWSIRAACRQNKSWKDAGLPQLPVTVSLPAYQLENERFRLLINDVLRENVLHPSQLLLQIAGNPQKSDIGVIQRMVEQLEQLGVGIVIDDYGAAHSLFNYIQPQSVVAVKINRGLVNGIGANRKDEAVLKTAIALLRSLQIKTVATGVETERQARFLSDEGCAAAQGAYYYQPMTAGSMANLLRSGRSERDLPKYGKKAGRGTTSDMEINCYLETKGIKHALAGYRYLLTAIRIGIDDRSQLARINELYGRIAQMYQTEPNNVERGIRHSIMKYGLPNKEFIVKAVDDLICWAAEPSIPPRKT